MIQAFCGSCGAVHSSKYRTICDACGKEILESLNPSASVNLICTDRKWLNLHAGCAGEISVACNICGAKMDPAHGQVFHDASKHLVLVAQLEEQPLPKR